MTRTTSALIGLIVTVIFSCALSAAEELKTLTTQKEKVSYAVGVEMAKSTRQPGMDLEAEAVRRGFNDALDGKELLMSTEDLRKHIAFFHKQLRRQQYPIKRPEMDKQTREKQEKKTQE